MTTELTPSEVSPEERALRLRNVRKWVFLRGLLLGMIIGAWWIFFAPDAVVDNEYKTILGVAVGVLATASYIFNLRTTLFPRK